ncbi:hypothetical protein ACLB2K_068995 [Fragaria x ananassa]
MAEEIEEQTHLCRSKPAERPNEQDSSLCHDVWAFSVIQFTVELTQRSHHGKQLKEKLAAAAHGMGSSVMRGLVVYLTLILVAVISTAISTPTAPFSVLFSLVHLRRLNLADNNFNYSQMPTTLKNFPRLRYLNLSFSVLSGHVPSEVSQLSSKLLSLDLSANTVSSQGLLKLKASNLAGLVQNLTSLETLYPSGINISSRIPDSMANLSFLTSLALRNCEFFCEFPTRIFDGYLSEFNQTSPLTRVILAGTNFSGNLPSSIGKLDSLKDLDVGACRFSGMVPFSLGNLKKLNYLDLSSNKFSGPIPASLANLTQLTYYLSLATNNFLRSPLLVTIDFVENSWNGSVPVSLFGLMELKQLSLSVNEPDGNVDFCKLRSGMTILQLGGNKLEVIAECGKKNTTVRSSSAKISRTEFVQHKRVSTFPNASTKLEVVGPFFEQIAWPNTKMDVEHKHTKFGFPEHQAKLPLKFWPTNYCPSLGNQLTGSPPIPPENIVYYSISDNNLLGEISPSICKLISLQYLDLSNNKLSGTIPQCLGNFSDDLRVLNLRNNSFQGILPQLYSNASNLRIIDVSYNQFHGQLPRSLANCGMLESLVLCSLLEGVLSSFLFP